MKKSLLFLLLLAALAGRAQQVDLHLPPVPSLHRPLPQAIMGKFLETIGGGVLLYQHLDHDSDIRLTAGAWGAFSAGVALEHSAWLMYGIEWARHLKAKKKSDRIKNF